MGRQAKAAAAVLEPEAPSAKRGRAILKLSPASAEERHEGSSPIEGPMGDPLVARRHKLDRLREEGIEPFPHAYPGVVPISTAIEAHGTLEAGAKTDSRYRVAGRLAACRGQGKATFIDLVDRSGRIQLHARMDDLGEECFGRLTDLDLGDLIGIDGTAFCSRRGQLSLRINDWALLAKALRPPPDKHHGLRDVETRFRRRELDLMASEEARQLFVTRARMISAIRRFLDGADFVEVETPVLQPLYGGASARPFLTHHNTLDRKLYLRIATELYLKRCIIGGLERVYELGKDFRNEGMSQSHNPEFTMLEFYEAYADYEDIASRVEALVEMATEVTGYDGELDFSSPWRRETVTEAILSRTGVDIRVARDREALATAMTAQGLPEPSRRHTWAQLVEKLLAKHVEPMLTEPTFLFDYPVELSPFAKRHRTDDRLVERWEAFAQGMEIANAFTELNDPDDQRRRFEMQFAQATGGKEAQPFDEGFLQALEQGMPPTGGVGIGVDRLAMLLTGRHSIREVVLFPTMRESYAEREFALG